MSKNKITTADREAAASVTILTELQELILDGRCDGGGMVQAFAKHRTAARNAVLEEAAKVADGNRTDDDSMWDRAAETIARMIRTLSTHDTPDMRATNKGEK